ncbi:hypothetical protein Tco_1009132, partial [Tanacetum coccineum]
VRRITRQNSHSYDKESIENVVAAMNGVILVHFQQTPYTLYQRTKARLFDGDRELRSTAGSVKPGEVIKELKTLAAIDKTLDQEVEELAQKAKIRWAIDGDENSRYFHGILNSKRSQLSIRGILNDEDWIDDPLMVKRVSWITSLIDSRSRTPPGLSWTLFSQSNFLLCNLMI